MYKNNNQKLNYYQKLHGKATHFNTIKAYQIQLLHMHSIFTLITTNGYDSSIALVHIKSNPNSCLYSVDHLQALPPAVWCIRCTKSKHQKSITLAQCVIMNFNFPNFYSGNLLTTIVSFGSQTFKCVPKIHLMRWDEDYKLLLESRS